MFTVPVFIDYASNTNVTNETNISSKDHTTYLRQDCMIPFSTETEGIITNTVDS